MPKALSAPDDCGSGLQPLKLSTEPVMFGTWPNISGELWGLSVPVSSPGSDGVFTFVRSEYAKSPSDGNGPLIVSNVRFSANTNKAIYSGNDLQSKALQTLACIRF